MQGFKSVHPKDIQESAISLLSDTWMLVTAGQIANEGEKSWNTMTASWGGLGYLWNTPVAFVFVRKERFTYEFTEKNDSMTLSFFENDYKKALSFCGTKSGRDYDKAKETGLTPIKTENNSVAFNEARIILECKKVYVDMIKESFFLDKAILDKWYKEEGLHQVYICEITKAWIK